MTLIPTKKKKLHNELNTYYIGNSESHQYRRKVPLKRNCWVFISIIDIHMNISVVLLFTVISRAAAFALILG